MNTKTVLLYSALLIISIFANFLEANPIYDKKKQDKIMNDIIIISSILIIISLFVGMCNQKK